MNKNVKLVAKYFYAITALVLSSIAPAMANMADAGEEPGEALKPLETILWFGVLPASIWAIVWFLWSIPKWRRNNEPKTGENWNPKPSSDVVNR